MTFTVAIPHDIADAGKDFLREKGYRVLIGTNPANPEDLKKEIAAADAILARLNPYTADVLAAAPRLKVIARHGIGVDSVDLDYCTRHGIQVTNAPVSNALSVSERTVAMIMAVAGHIPQMDRAVRKGDWGLRNRVNGVDLEGKTLGIVGFGRIGRGAAERCHAAFNMKILAYDPFLDADKFPGWAESASVEDVFSRSDFVSLHMPATRDTCGMVDAGLLGRMKKTAFLINCARGEVVKEMELVQALKDNAIAGAGLDVLAEEPPPADHPLFALDNVVITPHSAALTVESMDRMGLHAAQGIDDVLNGRMPEWPVNKPLRR